MGGINKAIETGKLALNKQSKNQPSKKDLIILH
jgi:hypothetical protein